MLQLLQMYTFFRKSVLKLANLDLMLLYHYVCVQMAEADKPNKKADKKKELDELNELFKPVVAAQKVSKGNTHDVILNLSLGPDNMFALLTLFLFFVVCRC